MIGVTELRSGTIFESEGQIYQVLSYEHIKMGRGSANIKVHIRNIRSGTTIDKSFINGAKVSEVHIQKKDMQFLYKDNDFAYFMDPQTFEQVQVNLIKFPDHQYLKEGETFSVSFLEKEPIALHVPPKMEFTVVETGPSVRGNSATNVFKDATLENGMVVKVPLFITNGNRIRVDTRTAVYSEKA